MNLMIAFLLPMEHFFSSIIKKELIYLPRRNINAREREEKKWSTEYIKALMRKLKSGTLEQAYEEPEPQPAERKRK